MTPLDISSLKVDDILILAEDVIAQAVVVVEVGHYDGPFVKVAMGNGGSNFFIDDSVSDEYIKQVYRDGILWWDSAKPTEVESSDSVAMQAALGEAEVRIGNDWEPGPLVVNEGILADIIEGSEHWTTKPTEVRHMETFPIMQSRIKYVPWELAKKCEAQIEANHGKQSLERLANRGGLAPDEFYYAYLGRSYYDTPRVTKEYAEGFIDELLLDWQASKCEPKGANKMTIEEQAYAAIEALREIANPILYMVRRLKPNERLDESAHNMVNDVNYLQSIANNCLHKIASDNTEVTE